MDCIEERKEMQDEISEALSSIVQNNLDCDDDQVVIT